MIAYDHVNRLLNARDRIRSALSFRTMPRSPRRMVFQTAGECHNQAAACSGDQKGPALPRFFNARNISDAYWCTRER